MDIELPEGLFDEEEEEELDIELPDELKPEDDYIGTHTEDIMTEHVMEQERTIMQRTQQNLIDYLWFKKYPFSEAYRQYLDSAEAGEDIPARAGAALRGLWRGTEHAPRQILSRTLDTYGFHEAAESVALDEPAYSWPRVIFDYHAELPLVAKIPLSLAASITLDPVTYTSIGDYTQLGKVARKLKSHSQVVSESIDNMSMEEAARQLKTTGIREGSPLYEKIMTAKEQGKTLELADDFPAQAELGQKALIQWNLPFGVDMGVYDPFHITKWFQNFAKGLKETETGKQLQDFVLEHFSAYPADAPQWVKEMFRHHSRGNTGKVFAEGQGMARELNTKKNEILAKYDNWGKEKLAQFIEKPKSFEGEHVPPEIKEYARNLFWEKNAEILRIESLKGAKVRDLQEQEMEYLAHLATEPAKRAMKKANPDFFENVTYRGQDGVIKFDPHQFQRKFRGKTIGELNQMAKDGKLENVLGDYKGKLFHDDPAYIQTMRNVRHLYKTESMDLLHKINAEGVRRGDFRYIGDKDYIPEGYVTISSEKAKGYEDIVGDYAYKPEIAKMIEGHTERHHPEFMGKFKEWHKKALSTWKAGTLLFGGSWFNKNAIGNLYRMYQMGFRDPQILWNSFKALRGKNPTITTEAGKKENYLDLIDQARERGIFRQGLWREIEQTVGQEITDKGTLREMLGKLAEKGFDIHRYTEDLTRFSMFVDSVKKGYGYDEAANISFKTLFDYQELAQFEKETVRQYIMPFYTYYRKNIPFQLEMMAKNPGSKAVIPKLRETAEMAFHEERDEPYYVPEWMQDEMPMYVPGVGEDPHFINIRQLLPGAQTFDYLPDPTAPLRGETLEELLETGRAIGTSAHPVLRGATDVLYGRDLFTGQEHPDIATFGGYPAPEGWDPVVHGLTGMWRPIDQTDRFLEAWRREYGDMAQEDWHRTFSEEFIRWVHGLPSQQIDTEQSLQWRIQELMSEIGDLEWDMRRAESEALQSEIESRILRLRDEIDKLYGLME